MTLDNSSEYPGDSAFGNSFGDDLNLIRKKFPKLEKKCPLLEKYLKKT